MPLNLVESIRNLFTPDIIDRAATQLGESDTHVQKAVHGLVPTVLTGILYQAGNDAGASNLLAYSQEVAGTTPPLQLGNTLFAPGHPFTAGPTDWSNRLFGEKTPGLAALVAAYAGVRESSALSLLQVVTVAAYSVIGQHAGSTSLGPGGVVALLHEQRDRILSAVPAGIPVAGILGLPALADVGERLHQAHMTYARPAASYSHLRERRQGRFPVVLVFLILLIIVAAAWFFLSGKHDGARNSLTTTDTTTIPTADTVVTTTTVTTTEKTDTIKH